MSDDWTPAFPGQRPPFRPGNQWRVGAGNQLAQTHGIHSARTVMPVAQRIAAELKALPELDYLTTGRFRDALWAYAQAQARVELYGVWLETLPFEQQGSDLNGTPPLETLRQLEVRAGYLGDRIGLTTTPADDVLASIRAARATLARRREREQFRADLLDALKTQQTQRGEQ